MKELVTHGKFEKTFVKVDLFNLGVTSEQNSFALVNIKEDELKMKIYINGRKRKIHMSIHEFEVIKKLVKILLKTINQ